MTARSPITDHGSPAGHRLPAYAKRLVGLRMAGHHPLFVGVLFSDDWLEARLRAQRESAALKLVGKVLKPFDPLWVEQVGHPLVAISPRDYRPGEYDLRCVTGCVAELHDGAGQAGDFEAPLYFLAGELAQHAAHVATPWAAGLPSEARRARALLGMGDEGGGMRGRWPGWWSDKLDEEHGAKFERWKAAASGKIAAERRLRTAA